MAWHEATIPERLRVLGAALAAAVLVGHAGHAIEPDGTLEVADPPDPAASTYDTNARYLPYATLVLNPLDSVSMTRTQVWRDNRHRAYQNPDQEIADPSGFLLFDVSALPPGSFVAGMRLRCHLENSFGSPYADPQVDIHACPEDDWGRGTVAAGEITLGDRLLDDASFSSFVPYHDFILDPAAHDWTEDLADRRITIGFRADVSHYGYVYFFGAGGSPAGPPPELIIRYQEPTALADRSWSRLKTMYR